MSGVGDGGASRSHLNLNGSIRGAINYNSKS